MATNEVDLATAALVIALSALVIALCQLLQQLFSAADGYRRCQKSVIGEWANLVELPFRWSSFRFEVKVTTPHFEAKNLKEIAGSSFLKDSKSPLPTFPYSFFSNVHKLMIDPHEPVAPMGSPISRFGTFTPAERVNSEDQASWVTLLEDIHDMQSVIRPQCEGDWLREDKWAVGDLDLICITRKTRSWDLMPPDVVRPIASTTVGCLVIMAHRLNMTWSQFDLDAGKLRAAGKGLRFSTSVVRGLGLVVEYSNDWNIKPSPESRWIPTAVADEVSSGVITNYLVPPFCSTFDLRNSHTWGSLLDYAVSYFLLPEDVEAVLHDSTHLHYDSGILPALGDLPGLMLDWVHRPNEFCNQIKNPFPFYSTSLGQYRQVWVVWSWYLEQDVENCSEQRKTLFSFYKAGFGQWSNTQHCKSTFDAATEYLKSITVTNENFYDNLIKAHVVVNSYSLKEAEKNIKQAEDYIKSGCNNKTRPWYKDGTYRRDPLLTERAVVYAENVPKIVEYLVTEYDCKVPSETIEDAWWTMMVRLQAWHGNLRIMRSDPEKERLPWLERNNSTRVFIL